MEKYALVLGGGGSRGAYEIGVWQALREMEIPINIVTGSSVGALNGVLVAQDRFQDSVDLWKDLETHMVFDIDDVPLDFQIGRIDAGNTVAYIKEFFTNGGAGTSGLSDIVHRYVDEDAVRSSDIEFGLVTVELSSVTPHYVFTSDIPEGKLADYILASAACFPALEVQDIDGRTFIDGGYADVLPVQMAADRGADHIIAVYLDGAGKVKKSRIEYARSKTKSFKLIQSAWNLGSVLKFDKDNARKIMRLGYLDTLKSFDKADGIKYTFEKGVFDRHDLEGADAAAETFGLDPTPVYTLESLRGALAPAVSESVLPELTITTIDDTLKQLGTAALVIYIAHDLQKKEADSIFLSRAAFRLLEDEIQAANFLIKYNLI